MIDYDTPIKMPRSTHYGNNYYEFMSYKLNRIVTAFSNLEYWNQICLEMDYKVEKYCEQPLRTTVFIDGNSYETIFDVWVRYQDGSEEFQEVKLSDELENADACSARSYRQIAVQKAWCEQNNRNYKVRTDRDILAGTHFIRNMLYLYPKVLRMEATDNVAEKHILKHISDRGSSSIGRLVNNGIISAQTGMTILAKLYHQGQIRFGDIENEPITFSTEVFMNGQ